MEVFELIPQRLYQSGQLSGEPEWHDVFQKVPRVTCVVDLASDLDGGTIPSGITYVHWPIDDGPLPDLDTYWAIAGMAWHMVEKGACVLSHCAAGINRSSFLSAAIVRHEYRISGTEAVDYVRSKRPGALSNKTFADFLCTLPA